MWTKRYREPALAGTSQSGVALLTALALLLLFSLLGTTYIRYMDIENRKTVFELRSVRATHTARAGIHAALAEIQAALEAGTAVPGKTGIELPVYWPNRRAPEGYAPTDTRRARAHVRIDEESNRININHAPPAVLERIFGIAPPAAQAIRDALPGGEEEEDDLWLMGGEKTWFFSLDNMIARGVLTPEVAARAQEDQITFYTVGDHDRPEGYFNINTARPWAIAAALGVDMATAEKVAAAQPFATMAALATAAGKPAEAFALPPEAFAFAPTAFHLVSEGVYSNVYAGGKEYRFSRRRAEAIAVFDADFAPVVRMWTEAPEAEEGEAESLEAAEAEVSVPADEPSTEDTAAGTPVQEEATASP